MATIGGDEFAILLSDTDRAGAHSALESLRHGLVELAEREDRKVGYSVGAAVFHSPVVDADAALQVTDQIMYRVKRSGGSRVEVKYIDGIVAKASDGIGVVAE